MSKIIRNSKSGNYLVFFATEKKFLKVWKNYTSVSAILYAKRNNLGLLLIDHEICPKNNKFYKKATWQKWLIPNYIKENFKNIKNICYLDCDIIINPAAPNIFNEYKFDKILVTSVRKNMPYTFEEVTRKISFLRKKFLKKNFPLNTSLIMTLKETYRYHNLPVLEDEFCAGFFGCNVKKYASFFKKAFLKYKSPVWSVTGGGDQTHFNYEVIKSKNYKVIDYKYQTLWSYEIAVKYPFLYKNLKTSINKKLITDCITSSLFSSYFLHFAGTWPDAKCFYNTKIYNSIFFKKYFYEYKDYEDKKIKAKPKGPIKFTK